MVLCVSNEFCRLWISCGCVWICMYVLCYDTIKSLSSNRMLLFNSVRLIMDNFFVNLVLSACCVALNLIWWAVRGGLPVHTLILPARCLLYFVYMYHLSWNIYFHKTTLSPWVRFPCVFLLELAQILTQLYTINTM